jgi:SAM-dependent methyltransferase
MVCAQSPRSGWRMVGGMSLSRCPECGFAWFPRSLYEGSSIEAQYIDDETSPTEYYRMMEPFDLKTFAIRMRLIVTLTGLVTGRVLDIGCNIGTFLEVAARFGWKAVGVEPNPRAAEIGEKRGLEVRCGFFDGSLASNLSNFDAVHAGDVIEHLFEPIEFLARVRNVLRPGGLLVVVTPDIDSALGRLLQIKPAEHLVYFTRESLHRAAELAGFRDVAVERWGRRRSISAMRYSTTFSSLTRRALRLLDIPGPRSLLEQLLYRLCRDELLLTAFCPAQGVSSTQGLERQRLR